MSAGSNVFTQCDRGLDDQRLKATESLGKWLVQRTRGAGHRELENTAEAPGKKSQGRLAIRDSRSLVKFRVAQELGLLCGLELLNAFLAAHMLRALVQPREPKPASQAEKSLVLASFLTLPS